MNTVICSNSICGKEYHESFKKCPFCGTDNLSFKESKNESTSPKSKSEINRDIFLSGLRIILCCVVAFIVLALCVFITQEISIEDTIWIKGFRAFIAVSAGTGLNYLLKKKNLSKNKKNDE